MRYKVGDKVMVRGNLKAGGIYGDDVFTGEMEKYKGKIAKIAKETCVGYELEDFMHNWTFEMLRPAEFKIWCETEEEKHAVLEELEKEGYVWCGNEEKPTNKKDDEFCFYSQMALYVTNSHIKWDDDRSYFESEYCIELTPSEFTGINFSEKIIIAKTQTGAMATYGDKTATAEGDFEDASRQALVEVLCPFKVGDKVRIKNISFIYTVKEILRNKEIEIIDNCGICRRIESDDLELCTEPSYNAKLFCIRGSGRVNGFERGYIYEVKDGRFTASNVDVGKFKNLEEINSKLIAQFMEIKGGLDE